MSKEKSKFLTDPAFTGSILNYLGHYIDRIADHIRQNPKPYQDLLDSGKITTINWNENEYERLKPHKHPVACPYCREYKDFRYFVYVFLDDNKIIDKCKAKEDLNRGWNIIIKSKYIACRAEFNFICDSKKEPPCHNEPHINYGHYIIIQGGPFKNIYDKRYCLGDILNDPQKYENI